MLYDLDLCNGSWSLKIYELNEYNHHVGINMNFKTTAVVVLSVPSIFDL